MLGYYSVVDACLSEDGYAKNIGSHGSPSDRVLLSPEESEIIIRPYHSKDLSVTIIIGGMWTSSMPPKVSTFTGIATYDPQHGYVIDHPLVDVNYANDKRETQKIYLVPEKNRLVLEAITPGPIGIHPGRIRSVKASLINANRSLYE